MMAFWYQRPVKWFLWLLYPLSFIATLVVRYRRRRRNRVSYPKPLVVVGNITIGGTGKTPMIQALTRMFAQRGLKVGIVSRGYGSHSQTYPLLIRESNTAFECGDEPKLLSESLNVPVVIDADRHRAVHHLLALCAVDVVISDDGLQHYRMARDVEIVMIDGRRGLGNQRMLPMGPLREPIERLKQVDFVVAKAFAPSQIPVDVVAKIRLKTPENSHGVRLGKDQPVTLMTAIGDGENFAQSLESIGYSITERVFLADHATIPDELLRQHSIIVITEKDAVKLDLSALAHVYVAAMTLDLPASFTDQLLARVEEKKNEKDTDYPR